MKNIGLTLGGMALTGLLSGCGGGDKGKTLDGNISNGNTSPITTPGTPPITTPGYVTDPELGKEEVFVKEGDKAILPTKDFCKNSTLKILNLNNLPPYYSLKDNNDTLEIDLTNTDIPEGNIIRYIPVVCENGNKEKDFNITSTEIDGKNDSPIRIVDSNLPTNILEGEDYKGTVVSIDSDGILGGTYEISTNEVIIEEGSMDCVNNDNIFGKATCNFSVSGLSPDNYEIKYSVNGVENGEEPNSLISGKKSFTVNSVKPAPVIDLDSVSVLGQDLIDHGNGVFSILQKTKTDVTLNLNSKDGNSKIVIEGKEYNGDSATISLFLDNGVSKVLHIKEYNGKYSNEIVITISGR